MRKLPEMSNESWQSVVDSVTSSLRREIAWNKIEKAKVASELASCQLTHAQIEERFYELNNAAACYVGKSKAFAEFGELTDRERKIAIKAARYVLFNRTD